MIGLDEPMDALAVYYVSDGVIERHWIGEARKSPS